MSDTYEEVRLARKGNNHLRPPGARLTLCNRLAKGKDLGAVPHGPRCARCKRKAEVREGSKKRRTYRTGRKDPGKMSRRGRRPDGLPHAFRLWEYKHKRKKEKMARESRRRNR